MRRLLLCGLVVALSGCASPPERPVSYPRQATLSALRVAPGRVVAVREVRIEGRHGVVGTVGGAAVGQATGRTVGDGSGERLAGAVGGVVGAVAGRAAERALTARAGLEITVELDNGQVLAVVQAADERFAVGDRVRVLRGRGIARVRPL